MMRGNVGTGRSGEVGGIEANTGLLDEAGREVRIGDRLLAVDAQPYDLQFFPHPPKQQLEYGRARVLAVTDTLSYGGPRDVVAQSVGAREGTDAGTVFSIWREGRHVAASRKTSAEFTRGAHTITAEGCLKGER